MRRIFVGGLDTEVKRNCRLPSEEDNKAMFTWKKEDGQNISSVFIPYPNNLVIADFEWLKRNWHVVEEWYNDKENYSRFQDCTVMENKDKVLLNGEELDEKDNG